MSVSKSIPIPPRVQDLTGRRFGRWTVLGYAGKKNGSHRWHCRCDCGIERIVAGENLKRGDTKSCGCYHSERVRSSRTDLTGKKFGWLTAEAYLGNSRWQCRCDCGRETTVKTSHLKSGHTRSCGCYIIARGAALQTTHGLSGTTAYWRWRTAIRRGKKQRLDINWSPEMVRALYEQQPACVLCGKEDDLTTDHVQPLSLGFGLEPGNAVTLCRSCNSTKCNKLLEDLPAKTRRKLITAAKSFADHWEEMRRETQSKLKRKEKEAAPTLGTNNG